MRRWTWAAAAGAAVAAVVAVLMPRAMVGVFYDDGVYLALAKSLAEGHGYRLLYLPGAPAAVHYPPLYPALLAALWKIWPAFPDNVMLFRAANALALGLFAGGFAAYLSWRRALPSAAAATVSVIGATAVPLLAVATVLFAEPVFLVFALGSWFLADAAAVETRRSLALAVAAGIVAGLAALTRSIGVAIAAGVVVSLLVRKRRREALAAAVPAVLLLAPWMVWTAAHRGAVEQVLVANYGTYGDLLRQAGWGLLSLEALWGVLRPLGNLALSTVKPAWHAAVGLPALAVLVAGCVVLARRAPALGWSLAFYALVVLVWPYAPDRFVWVVLPVLAVAMVLGAMSAWRAAAERQGRRRPLLRGLVIACVLPVVAGFGAYQANGFVKGWATSTQRAISARFERVIPWVLSATRDDAVLAGEDEALLWLYTGRKAVPSFLWYVRGRESRVFGVDSVKAFYDRSGVTHVLVTGPASEAAPTVDEMLARYPGYLRTVWIWRGPMMALAVERGVPAEEPAPGR